MARHQTWCALHEQYVQPAIHEAMKDSDAVNCPSIEINHRGARVELDLDTVWDDAGARPHLAKRKATSLARDRSDTVASQPLRSPAWHRVKAMAVNLPSNYALAITTHSALSKATEVEKQLRQGQANDALDDLRAHLITSYAVKQEKRVGSGQIHNTRSNIKIKNHKQAVDAAASRYRLARGNLLSLGLSSEDQTYRELKVTDVVPFTVYTVDQQLGDSKRQPSWIWSDFRFVKGQNKEIRQYCEESKSILSLLHVTLLT